MSESIYACRFSSGLIKVGRSIDPIGRIAAHADRVSCMGIDVIETHHSECVGSAVSAERALIIRCCESATKRHKSEWFDGLCFPSVVSWVNEIAASVDFDHVAGDFNFAFKTYFMAMTMPEREDFAARCGTSKAHLTNIAGGHKLCGDGLALAIERESGGVVLTETLRPDLEASMVFIRGTKKAA